MRRASCTQEISIRLQTGAYELPCLKLISIPGRHLGAAWIERLQPDLLITETTYANTIRDSKRTRERDFLKKVHACVARGGKVSCQSCRRVVSSVAWQCLIPVFALGRAQELCMLLNAYWERTGLTVPVEAHPVRRQSTHAASGRSILQLG